MSRTISARLSQTETETLNGLARQKGVSRSQLLASIAKQAVDTEARHLIDNVNIVAKQRVNTQARQAMDEAKQAQSKSSILRMMRFRMYRDVSPPIYLSRLR